MDRSGERDGKRPDLIDGSAILVATYGVRRAPAWPSSVAEQPSLPPPLPSSWIIAIPDAPGTREQRRKNSSEYRSDVTLRSHPIMSSLEGSIWMEEDSSFFFSFMFFLFFYPSLPRLFRERNLNFHGKKEKPTRAAE